MEVEYDFASEAAVLHSISATGFLCIDDIALLEPRVTEATAMRVRRSRTEMAAKRELEAKEKAIAEQLKREILENKQEGLRLLQERYEAKERFRAAFIQARASNPTLNERQIASMIGIANWLAYEFDAEFPQPVG